MAKTNNQSQTIDKKQVLEYLHRAFEEAASPLGPKSKAVKGTTLYDYQVDFAYLVNDIQRGPPYILPKVISDANDLIENLRSETR